MAHFEKFCSGGNLFEIKEPLKKNKNYKMQPMKNK